MISLYSKYSIWFKCDQDDLLSYYDQLSNFCVQYMKVKSFDFFKGVEGDYLFGVTTNCSVDSNDFEDYFDKLQDFIKNGLKGVRLLAGIVVAETDVSRVNIRGLNVEFNE